MTKKTFTLFEKYLDGSMDEVQKIEFEVILKTDKNISQLFSEFTLATKAVSMLGRKELHQMLTEIMNEPQKTLTAGRKKATLKELLDNIFNDFFIPFDNILTSRSDTVVDKKFLTGLSFYSKGDFKSASKIFKELMVTNSGDPVLLFYYGISELALDNYESSKKLFKKIIPLNKDLLKELAQWYLGLSCLKSGDIKSAKKHFESLENKSLFYDKDKILLRISSL